MEAAPTSTIFTDRSSTSLIHHVNHSLKNWETNKVYDDLDDLANDVKAWIASTNYDFFYHGIDRLPNKWEAVLEVDGEYAPE